MLRYFKD